MLIRPVPRRDSRRIGAVQAPLVDVRATFGKNYRERAQVALCHIGALGLKDASYVMADAGKAFAARDSARAHVRLSTDPVSSRLSARTPNTHGRGGAFTKKIMRMPT